MTSLGRTYLQAEVGPLVPSLGAAWIKTAAQKGYDQQPAGGQAGRETSATQFDLGTESLPFHHAVAAGVQPLYAAQAANAQGLASWRGVAAGGQLQPYNPAMYGGRMSPLQAAMPVVSELGGPAAGMVASFTPMLLNMLGMKDLATKLSTPQRMLYGGGNEAAVREFQEFSQEAVRANQDIVATATGSLVQKLAQQLPETPRKFLIEQALKSESVRTQLGLPAQYDAATLPNEVALADQTIRSNPRILDGLIKRPDGSAGPMAQIAGQLIGMVYSMDDQGRQLIETFMPEYVANIQPIMESALYATGGVPDVNKLKQFNAEFEQIYNGMRGQVDGTTVPKGTMMEAYAFAKYHTRDTPGPVTQALVQNLVRANQQIRAPMGVVLRLAQAHGIDNLKQPGAVDGLIATVRDFQQSTGNASPDMLAALVEQSQAAGKQQPLSSIIQDAKAQSLAGQFSRGAGNVGLAVRQGAGEALARGRESGRARVVAALKMMGDKATIDALKRGDAVALNKAIKRGQGAATIYAQRMDPALINTALSGNDMNLIVGSTDIMHRQRMGIKLQGRDQQILEQLAQNPGLQTKLFPQLSRQAQMYYLRGGNRLLGTVATQAGAKEHTAKRNAALKRVPPQPAAVQQQQTANPVQAAPKAQPAKTPANVPAVSALEPAKPIDTVVDQVYNANKPVAA